MTETTQIIATDLYLVRQMRNLNDILEAHVAEHIQDGEHAAVRRILRSWENRLQDALPSERRRRKDAGTKREREVSA